MQIHQLFISSRSITFEFLGKGAYYSDVKLDLYLNGMFLRQTKQVINSLYELTPETEYLLEIKNDNIVIGNLSFQTEYEFVTLNVLDFGAKGDGVKDDTLNIQAAIMACPQKGRIVIPEGIYKVRNLFLKSHVRLEFKKNAELSAETDREKLSILPGMIQSYDEKEEYNLGTWEGNPLDSYAAILTGLYVEDVIIYGEGIINGNATKENWWKNPKVKKEAFRPKLVFLNHCKNIVIQGIQMKNSPSWVLHPYFSDHLKFYNLMITNPKDSPNTDGIDPESCEDVEIFGVHFSLGDDCIAIKSGKIYMGTAYRKASNNIKIRHCLMENGHGAVTMGSEMSGGIYDVHVENCIFSHTDRGLRIKTRRGRGTYAIIDDIVFHKIQMESVKIPFVINSFYFCDPDGKSDYVQSRKKGILDKNTPEIRKIRITEITCKNCHAEIAHFEGLPEKKIEYIYLDHIYAEFAESPKAEVPAMTNNMKACIRKGMFISNVEKIYMKNVEIVGFVGEKVVAEHVNEYIEE